MEHFIEGGKTLEEMAEFFGITVSTVWLWMQKFGVQNRRVMTLGENIPPMIEPPPPFL